KEPLNLFSAQVADALKEWTDFELGAALGEQHAPLSDLVARVALAHRHLVGALISASRHHRQCVADGPKAQESDAELALQSIGTALGLQTPLDRVADMGCDILEIGQALLVAGHAIA